MVKVTTYDGKKFGEEAFPEASGVNLTPNGDLLIVAPVLGGPAQGGRIIRTIAAGYWKSASAEESKIMQHPRGMSMKENLPGQPVGRG